MTSPWYGDAYKGWTNSSKEHKDGFRDYVRNILNANKHTGSSSLKKEQDDKKSN